MSDQDSADLRELLAAERLQDALDALEGGERAPVDPHLDPELAALVQTASLLRSGLQASTETLDYRRYRTRSRAYVLHTLERQGDRLPVDLAAARERRRRPRWARPWLLVAPVAAAAAALALLIAPSDGAPGTPAVPAAGPEAPAQATNRTSDTTESELLRIRLALGEIAVRNARGEPVDARLLRTVTESTAAVANQIETAPQSLTRPAVSAYQQTVALGRNVLSTAQPAAGSESALAAARLAADDGVITASRFLDGSAGPWPTAVPSTAPAPSATPSATLTPAATSTPRPTATPTPTPPATPTSNATPPAAPASTGTPASPQGAAPTDGALRP